MNRLTFASDLKPYRMCGQWFLTLKSLYISQWVTVCFYPPCSHLLKIWP